CTLENGLTIVEGDGDMKKMYDMAEMYGLIDLYITYPSKNLAEWEMTMKELEIPMSVGSLAGSAANVPNEELEMAIAGPVDNNIVGAEVVPFSMGRSVLARTVAQRTAIPLSFKKGKHVVLADLGPCSPKSVPDFAPCDEACKTLSGATTKGQRPKRTIKLPLHLQDYAM
ncbi:hypothetical protein Tco_0583127, partial [Tanacetum coccineum]